MKWMRSPGGNRPLVPPPPRGGWVSPLLGLSFLPLADNLSIFEPVSKPAYSIREFFFMVLAILAAIFVIVEGLILYCAFRFRQRPGQEGEPPQIYGSRPIEVAWTAAPVLIVFLLFLIVIRSVGQVRQNQPPPSAFRVLVVGHQWWWEYRYLKPGGQEVLLTTANELHVPVSDARHKRPIYLELESVDVIHDFWVPRLAGKTDVIPGRTNLMWFQPEETGTFTGQCAEYCGPQHANMMIKVIVQSPEDFDSWQKKQQQPARPPAGEEAKRGLEVFESQACVNCHMIRGTRARGTVGPDLTHLMSRHTLASGMIPNDPDRLKAWVANPQAIKPACKMPNMRLNKREVDLLVAYLKTLR